MGCAKCRDSSERRPEQRVPHRGVSAGANMAGAIAYFARDEGSTPPITGLWLSVPCCLSPRAFDLVPQWKAELLSVEQNSKADLLNVPIYEQLVHGTWPRIIDSEWMHFCYRETSLTLHVDILQAPVEDRRLSFLLHSCHSSLPTRAYFQIGGLDPLRDEGMLFARLLRDESGAKTLIHMYSGLPHGFWRFQQLPVSRDWDKDLVEGTRFLLRGGEGGMVVKGLGEAMFHS